MRQAWVYTVECVEGTVVYSMCRKAWLFTVGCVEGMVIYICVEGMVIYHMCRRYGYLQHDV